jgi:23S rRNA (cytosine1962-C5)-methyltransferase
MRSVYLRGNDAPRSPRIFRKRLRRADDGIRPGEVVAVRTADGGFVGRAFYSARSQIGARILDRDETGPPVDAAWFRDRIGAAAALRRDVLRLDEITNAYRVVHAEGDGLPALVIDRYDDVAVIEVGARGTFEHLEAIEEAVTAVLGTKRTVVRADPNAERIEGFKARDRRAGDVRTVVHEYDLNFHVDCTGGHKTGFFVDQRDGRALVRGLSEGRRVLDLCCYTGGFALAAQRGGAESVTAVDLDEEALDVARENAALNEADVEFVHADTFDFLRDTKARPDLVVLDPPKLAAKREHLGRARRKSVDFNRLAFEALAPGGLLFTFSCTGLFSPDDFLGHVREAAIRAGREGRVLQVTGQPPDHPVALDCPEGRYLTGVLVHAS